MPFCTKNDFDTANTLKTNCVKINVKKSKLMWYWKVERWNIKKTELSTIKRNTKWKDSL